MKDLVGKLILQFIGLFAAYALLLFLPAGTLAWVAGWAYLALFFGWSIALSIWLLKANPELLQERMTGMGRADQKAWDKSLMALVAMVFIAWMILMPLDAVRFQWSHVPIWVQVAGGVMFSVGYYIMLQVFRVNSYLSPAVRIQQEREQTVITTGPYRYVRHPMYAGTIFFFSGTSLLLGSWYGLLGAALLVILIARRAVLEERTLRDELPGYQEYMTHVKYRLIPHIW